MLLLVAASVEDHKNGIGTATSLPQRRDLGTLQNWGRWYILIILWC